MHVFYVLALSHLLRIALFHRQNSLLHPVFCSVACSTLAKLRKMRKYALIKILRGWSLSKQLGSRYPHCVNLKLIHFEHISQFSLISANAFLYFQHNFHAIMLLSLFFCTQRCRKIFSWGFHSEILYFVNLLWSLKDGIVYVQICLINDLKYQTYISPMIVQQPVVRKKVNYIPRSSSPGQTQHKTQNANNDIAVPLRYPTEFRPLCKLYTSTSITLRFIWAIIETA